MSEKRYAIYIEGNYELQQEILDIAKSELGVKCFVIDLEKRKEDETRNNNNN